MGILSYIGKMLLCSAVLYGYYHLLLRNRRYHHYNRYYLLFASLLSLAIPLIHISLPGESDTGYPVVYKALQVITVTNNDVQLPDEPAWAGITGGMLQAFIISMYLIVSLLLLFNVLRAIRYVYRISRRYAFIWMGPVRFFNTNEPAAPFSFYNSIYWNRMVDTDTEEGRQMLQHELFHVKQRHTLDLLWMECCCIIWWCNPFFFLIKKELKAIHEFLADQHAVETADVHTYMESLLLKAIADKRNAVSHYFFQSPLKRRIHMLLYQSNRSYSYVSRLLALPLLLFLFCTVALYAKPVSSDDSVVMAKQPLTIVVDPGHGGGDAGVTGKGGLSEKDIVLELAHVIRTIAPVYHVNVVLTRDHDQLPGGGQNSIKSRVQLAQQIKADLFVSLHMNEPGALEEKGFDIYIPSEKRGNAYREQAYRLGSLMVASLKNIVPVKEQLQQSVEKGVFVLDHAVCPAILIECGRINQAEDLSFITSKANQEAVARRILSAAVAYSNLAQ